MASETVRALLNHVLSTLEPLGFPCALMGGAALAAWNHPRATRDIDLLIGIVGSDVDRLIAEFEATGCRLRHDSPVSTLGSLKFVQFLYTPPGEFYDAQFDLWLAETELQKSAIARRQRRDVPGVSSPLYVLSCDDLILFKLLAGRMIDRADAAVLLRENRDSMDMPYLLGWLARLDLMRDFSEIWREAIPHEPLPTM